jgi:uncharacterized protein YjdB
MTSAVRKTVGTALGLLSLAGCGGGGDGGGGDCDPIAATLVSRIEVDPATLSVADGESAQLTARAFSCDGSQLPATFTWQSSDATTVSVSPSGLVSGVKLGGPVAVRAAAQGKEGSAAISIVARAVASVRVEPATANVAVGRTSTLVARAFDAQGNELPGRTATWRSGDETIVTVSQQGGITGVVAGGPVTITATIEGHSGTSQVTVVNAAVASVTVTPPTATIQAGSTVQLTAVLKDDQGNVLTGRALLWTTADGARASVSTTGLVTGVAPGGPVSVLATSEGVSGGSEVTVTPSPPTRLAFLTQPGTVAVGDAITPGVQVEIQNAQGQRVATSSAPVALTLNPASGSLSGTTTVAAVNGVATFNDLRIGRPGAGYTLRATTTGLTGASSGTFSVNAGPPVAIRFVQQPGSMVAGASFVPPVQVEVIDAGGNRATSADPIVLAISNPGVLTGTTSVIAVNGLATFGDLGVATAGAGFTLSATSGALPAITSNAFNVTPGAPASVSFTVQPGDVVAGFPISPAVQVEVRDAQGNLVDVPATVVVSLATNPGGAALSGTTTTSTVAGVATFDDLSLDIAGDGYTLEATVGDLSATSAPFNVTAGAGATVGFSVQPSDIQENVPFMPQVAVEVRDQFGNRVTGFVGSVSLQLRSESGGSAGGGNQLVGGGTRAFVLGLASFSGMTVNLGFESRTFTLRTNGTLAQVLSTPFRVTD